MSYDTWEAARLISWSNKQAGIGPLKEEELTEWINSGVGGLEWEDVWEEDGKVEKYINFPTLISLRLICLLHSNDVSLEDINKVALLSKQELDLDWPFASRSLWDWPLQDTQTNVTTIDSDVMHRIVVIMMTFPVLPCDLAGALEFDEGEIACAWRPVKGIVIDPRVVSGSPCVAGTRTPTGVFPGMLEGGDTVKALAKGYRLTEEQVQNALEWEKQLDVAGI